MSQLVLDRLFLTDGGLETDMIFKRGFELPQFASITLLQSTQGRAELRDYYRSYLSLAERLGTGFELTSATWRASSDWAATLGWSQSDLDDLNRRAVELCQEVRAEHASPDLPIIVSGCIGPRGDGYDPGQLMTAGEAQAYHQRQIGILISAGVDIISAMTMTNIPEALGIVRAAQRQKIPVVISFTVETSGALPTGDALFAAISEVDSETDGYPSFYMINCAHPEHFEQVLKDGGEQVHRIGGIRANASRCSHAELEVMTELDEGDTDELARAYSDMLENWPGIRLVGGCCGTDIRHIAAIGRACVDHGTTLHSAGAWNATEQC